MPKFIITLARLVRETVTVRAEAEDLDAARKMASDIYEADKYADEDLKWQPDFEWGCDPGTHDVSEEI